MPSVFSAVRHAEERCRSVYRTIELSNGWTGYIIHTQRYFSASLVVFDCVCVLTNASNRLARWRYDLSRDVRYEYLPPRTAPWQRGGLEAHCSLTCSPAGRLEGSNVARRRSGSLACVERYSSASPRRFTVRYMLGTRVRT